MSESLLETIHRIIPEYGLFIPRSMVAYGAKYNKSGHLLILLAVIHHCCEMEGECTETNRTFGLILDRSVRQVRYMLKTLEQDKVIRITMNQGYLRSITTALYVNENNHE